jgi:hypothetical protein
MEQQAASEAMEQQNKLDTLLESLYKTSEEERRVAERLDQLRKEQRVLEENRAQRLKQYNERREKDWEEALARERQLMRAMQVLLLSWVIEFFPIWNEHRALLCEQYQALDLLAMLSRLKWIVQSFMSIGRCQNCTCGQA